MSSRREPYHVEERRLRKDQTCGCVGEMVRCVCGRERCEDHAVMTADGVRCEVCMR